MYTPGQNIGAYQGLTVLLDMIGHAISLAPKPQQDSLRKELHDLVAKLRQVSINFPFGDQQAELKNLTYRTSTSLTQRAGTELEIIRIWSDALFQKSIFVLPATEKGDKAKSILNSAKSLFEKEKLFRDTTDDAYYRARDAVKTIVGSPLMKIGVIALIGYFLYSWLVKTPSETRSQK